MALTEKPCGYSVRQSLLRPTESAGNMRTSSKESGAFPIWDCGSPLYDSHELVSLAYTIERHMIMWPCLGGPKPIITSLSDPQRASSTRRVTRGSSMVTSLSEFLVKRKLTPQKKTKKHKKTKARFSGLVCGGNRLYTHE